MKIKKLFLVFVIVFLLNACSPKLANEHESMGDIYILTSQHADTGFTRVLFHLPSDCFINESECPTPTPVSAFPKNFAPYNWADMYWSPNGKFMFFVDHQINESKNYYLDELLLYNAQSGEIKKIISGYKYISGITWNPNSEWAAMAIKKLDDKEMQIVMVSPDGTLRFLPIKTAVDAGYFPHIFNGQVFDDNQHPVQWLDENNLFFIRTRGEGQTENPDLPPLVSVMHLFKFNVFTGVETEIQLPVRTSYYLLSPDSNFAYFTENKILKTYDFRNKEIAELRDFPPPWITANWSPDSKWLLVCGKDNITYVVKPNMTSKQKIMDGCPVYPIWMPDSDHIILLFMSFSDYVNISESHWYVASISNKTVREVLIPNLNITRSDSINGIYVQPIK